MIGRTDLVPIECDVCRGNRIDPRERTRPCVECNGTGNIHRCQDCGGIWRRECKEVCLDQTTCLMSEVPSCMTCKNENYKKNCFGCLGPGEIQSNFEPVGECSKCGKLLNGKGDCLNNKCSIHYMSTDTRMKT